MTATCSGVAIIQHVFILLMSEASLENGVNPTSIQGIIQDKIVLRVVTDVAENAGSGDKLVNLHTKDQKC